MKETYSKNLKLLRNATLKLLDHRQPADSLRPEVMEIVEVLRNLSKFQINQNEDISNGQTWTENGRALSPTMAAMCAEDYVRTAVFIRGLYDAVQDIRRRESDRPIRILYAGSGPYATLAMPLMSVLPIEEVRFEILDLHRESIESVKSLVKGLELSEYISNYEVIDAGLKQISTEEPPDIIVLELMTACLEREPQVAITRHLLQQAPDAIIVPESITIDARLINFGREFTSHAPKQTSDKFQREQISLEKVFELSSETVRLWKNIKTDKLPASSVTIPYNLEPNSQLMLCTKIQVYRDHYLLEFQSGLTSPITFPECGTIKAGKTFQFHYQLGKSPGLICTAI